MFKSTFKFLTLTALLACGLIAISAQAQDGEFNIEQLAGGLEPKVNINFGPAMMAGFAESMSSANPDMSSVLGGIQGLRLMVFEDLGNTAGLENAIDMAVDQLLGGGWSQALQVNEDDEQVDLYMRESGQFVTGMVLMVRESGDSVVLANIHGEMDPVLVGRIVSSGNMFESLDFDGMFDDSKGN